MKLGEALGVGGGIVCAVGAGGKKSVLHALAREHAASDGRLAMTATARCTPPPLGLFDAMLDAAPERLSATVLASPATRLFYAGAQARPGRFEGVDPAEVERIHRDGGFGLTLVKADGARMRWIKAPADDEPVLVPDVGLVVAVLSMRALGRPLDEKSAHRPERIAALAATGAGEAVTEALLATLLASPVGSLHRCDGLRVVPVLNMVDDEHALGAAMRIATDVLERQPRYERVVLACLRDPAQPRVWVCRR